MREATPPFADKLNIRPSDRSESTVGQIVCPVCGYSFVHINDAENLAGNDNYDAVTDGWVRGDVIVIPMWCEMGCTWKMQIGFHKGETFIRNVLTEVQHV